MQLDVNIHATRMKSCGLRLQACMHTSKTLKNKHEEQGREGKTKSSYIKHKFPGGHSSSLIKRSIRSSPGHWWMFLKLPNGTEIKQLNGETFTN